MTDGNRYRERQRTTENDRERKKKMPYRNANTPLNSTLNIVNLFHQTKKVLYIILNIKKNCKLI